MSSKTLERLHENLTGEYDSARQAVDTFAYKLIDGEPATEFEWGVGAVRSAARAAIFSKFITEVESFQEDDPGNEGRTDEEALALLLDEARKQAIHGARDPKDSTSPMSNLVERYKTAAWAEAADMIERY